VLFWDTPLLSWGYFTHYQELTPPSPLFGFSASQSVPITLTVTCARGHPADRGRGTESEISAFSSDGTGDGETAPSRHGLAGAHPCRPDVKRLILDLFDVLLE